MSLSAIACPYVATPVFLNFRSEVVEPTRFAIVFWDGPGDTLYAFEDREAAALRAKRPARVGEETGVIVYEVLGDVEARCQLDELLERRDDHVVAGERYAGRRGACVRRSGSRRSRSGRGLGGGWRRHRLGRPGGLAVLAGDGEQTGQEPSGGSRAVGRR